MRSRVMLNAEVEHNLTRTGGRRARYVSEPVSEPVKMSLREARAVLRRGERPRSAEKERPRSAEKKERVSRRPLAEGDAGVESRRRDPGRKKEKEDPVRV